MNAKQIEKQFKQIGARVKLGPPGRRGSFREFTIDIRSDKRGEYFEILLNREKDIELLVVDTRPSDRHLLLMVKEAPERRGRLPIKYRYLCGHDERAWFVAAVPSGASVDAAKEALKPPVVGASQLSTGLKRKRRHSRRNPAFLRQGEWFFVPCPDFHPDDWLVLRNEPLRRAGGKPHLVDFLYRRAGETVYTNREYPNGLTEEERAALIRRDPAMRHSPWDTMRRDPEVFVMGKVRHPDHKTIVLPCWHRVAMNTESKAPGSLSVAFLD
jgi:hypothetical protein